MAQMKMGRAWSATIAASTRNQHLSDAQSTFRLAALCRRRAKRSIIPSSA